MAKSTRSSRNHFMPLLSRHALGALLFFAATAAHAQYVWIGPDGTRQYADRPPPPGTPASKILKSPGRPALEPSTSPETPAENKGAATPPTLAERDAAFRQRSKARAEQEQKSQEEAGRRRRLAEHCASARETQANLASGIRVARIGPDGEKTYMSDEEKAARNEQVRRALQECR
jgi:type IV secretory pathway VirB10-like protein